MRLDEDDDQAEAFMRLRIRSMTKMRLSWAEDKADDQAEAVMRLRNRSITRLRLS